MSRLAERIQTESVLTVKRMDSGSAVIAESLPSEPAMGIGGVGLS